MAETEPTKEQLLKRIAELEQQAHAKKPAMALHRAPGRGLAQCRDLLDPGEPPASRHQSPGVPDGCAGAAACGQDQRNPQPHAGELETAPSQHQLKVARPENAAARADGLAPSSRGCTSLTAYL